MPNTWSRCFDKNANGKIDDHHECNGDYELAFPLPEELAQNGTTPFKWVSVNWNPMGHPPPAPPVWAVPHLDPLLHHGARCGAADPAWPMQRADPLR